MNESPAKVKPVHAHAFFTLDLSGAFNQILCFDYHDPDAYYYRLLEDEEGYREELERLLTSMNDLLSSEEIRVNGVRVEAEALMINLDFRGEAERPAITFYIEFRGGLKPGENVYECVYEAGTAEYDYEVYWLLPEGSKILKVETSTSYEIYDERFLVMWARLGDSYDGYEKIVFKISPQAFQPSRSSRQAP